MTMSRPVASFSPPPGNTGLVTGSRIVIVGHWFFIFIGLFFLILIVATTAQPPNVRTDMPKGLPGGNLNMKVEALLRSYSQVLLQVEQLPLIGRWWTTIDPMPDGDIMGPFLGKRDSYSLKHKRKRKLAIRPFVRFYVESHISRQLLTLTRRLRYQGLAVEDTPTDVKQAREIVQALDSQILSLFDWGRLRKSLTKISIIPTTVGALTAFAGAVAGLHPITRKNAEKGLVDQLQIIAGPSIVSRLIVVLLLLLTVLYILYLLIIPLIATGFNVKKALFSGGRMSGPEDDLGFVRYTYRVWEGFPNFDVYRAEDELFEMLKLDKRREVQVDLVFSLFPYFTVSLAAASEAILLSYHRLQPYFIFFQIPLILLGLQIVGERRLYKRRAWEGHI